MTPEEQAAHNARQGVNPHVQQHTDFLSSDIELQKGLKLLSHTEFLTWREENKEGLGHMVRSEIYKPESTKRTEQTKREMEKSGVEFVDYKTVDWSSAPGNDWEIESWRTQTATGAHTGQTLITIKRPRDEYSFDRLHLTRADLENQFTTATLDELLSKYYEGTRSIWAKKAELLRRNDVNAKSKEIQNTARDEIGSAAQVVATFDAMTNAEKASAFNDVAFRDRYTAAKNLISAVRAFK